MRIPEIIFFINTEKPQLSKNCRNKLVRTFDRRNITKWRFCHLSRNEGM